MNDDEPNCWTCAYSNFPETAEPCASCDMYFSHFEPSESTQATDTAASEDARREAEMAGPTCLTCKHKRVSIKEEPCISCNGYQNYIPDESAPCAEGTDENDDVLSPCSTCKYGDLPGTTEPCASCFDEGLDHPLNYEEATESGDEGSTDFERKGIVPQHIVDMFTERVGQEVRRHFEACDARPRPCPYCGEIPEVVGETIYPGEEHCYVVCNGAKLLPHSISIHGLTREEAVARWNSFVLTMKSQEK